MAKASAKGCVISLDDSAGTPRAISTYVKSYEIEQDAGKIEMTGFTDGMVNYIPGLPVYGVTLDLYWDAVTADVASFTVLRGIFGSSTSKTLSITPESGGPAFSGEFMLDALPVKGTPNGSIDIGTVHFSPMGTVAPTFTS